MIEDNIYKMYMYVRPLNGLDGIFLSKCSKDKILVIFDNIHVIVLFSKAP